MHEIIYVSTEHQNNTLTALKIKMEANLSFKLSLQIVEVNLLNVLTIDETNK